MNNQEIRAIAMKQSAFDLNCTAEDFTRGNPKVVLSASSEQARKYLELPFFCNLVSYGFNTVASVDPRIAEFIQGFLENRLAYRCFETPAIHLLTEEFSKYGKVICYMAQYFLPDV